MRESIVILGALSLTACAATGGGLFGSSAPEENDELPGATASNLDTGSLGIYLETMQLLVEGDRVVQAEIFEDASIAAALAPTTTNRLRLALALSIPGHAAADPLQAQRLLGELLALGNTLLPEERILATIHLQEVEQRLILDAASEQQQRETADELASLNAESARQLEAMRQENQRLQDALAEAEEKLEAITSIERSIRARDTATDVP